MRKLAMLLTPLLVLALLLTAVGGLPWIHGTLIAILLGILASTIQTAESIHE